MLKPNTLKINLDPSALSTGNSIPTISSSTLHLDTNVGSTMPREPPIALCRPPIQLHLALLRPFHRPVLPVSATPVQGQGTGLGKRVADEHGAKESYGMEDPEWGMRGM